MMFTTRYNWHVTRWKAQLERLKTSSNMACSYRKEVEVIVATLRSQGWECHISGKTHWRLCPMDNKYPVQFISFTPSDFRAIKNIRSQLRKAGANL